MVGNKARVRRERFYYASVYCITECDGMCAEGACVLECVDSALEGKPRPHDADAKDQATAETASATGLHDPEPGGAVSMESPQDTTSGEVLPYRLVYGQSPLSDYWIKVVDDRSR